MELLRFFTAGNVDDGKSTLIGRLLYDSHSVSTDIIETLTRQNKYSDGAGEIDLAQLTDGLRAEREQGITIDVAYKYFTTARRKFIIADTPGHLQYTRNMFTGASNAHLAIILVDARHGITGQTRRHSILSSILGIREVVLCINKMDLANYSQQRFDQIKEEYFDFAKQIGLEQVAAIPTNAHAGDNVVNSSANMAWYKGPTLLHFLEQVSVPADGAGGPARFQVQYVIRPQTKALPDYRGYAGTVLGGAYHKGQRVQVLPSGTETHIKAIEVNQLEVETAVAGTPAVLHLEQELGISRGSSIVPAGQLPTVSKEITATICWMEAAKFMPGQALVLQHNSFKTKAVIKEVSGKIDIHTFNELPGDGEIQLNDICRIKIKTAEPLCFDAYSKNKQNGSFILISGHTHNTVAAGTIQS